MNDPLESQEPARADREPTEREILFRGLLEDADNYAQTCAEDGTRDYAEAERDCLIDNLRAALAVPAPADQSRAMFVARIETAKRDGRNLTPDNVLGLLDDCDMLANRENAPAPTEPTHGWMLIEDSASMWMRKPSFEPAEGYRWIQVLATPQAQSPTEPGSTPGAQYAKGYEDGYAACERLSLLRKQHETEPSGEGLYELYLTLMEGRGFEHEPDWQALDEGEQRVWQDLAQPQGRSQSGAVPPALTDEQIDAIGLECSDYDDPEYFRVMARAVEREVRAALAAGSLPASSGEKA